MTVVLCSPTDPTGFVGGGQFLMVTEAVLGLSVSKTLHLLLREAVWQMQILLRRVSSCLQIKNTYRHSVWGVVI